MPSLPSLIFRTPQEDDLSLIAADMRDMDRLECEAFNLPPLLGLQASASSSVMRWTLERDGQPVGMLGVSATSIFARDARPWLLGATPLQEERRRFLTLARTKLAEIELVFPRLWNLIHRDNAVSQRWLTRLGFVVEPEVVHVGEQPMQYFHKGFPECASIPSQP